MKKLTLDLDKLAVESFASSDVREGRGTVNGHSGQPVASCSYTTMIAHYCYSDSNVMDCPQDNTAHTCDGGCPIDP